MRWSARAHEEPWGKLARSDGDGQPESYHPLIAHCVDVAVCCEALLAIETVQRRLARLADRDTLEETTLARLCVLCGLHDLGKLNHGFQAKATPGRSRRGHVAEALALLKGRYRSDALFNALHLSRLGAWGEAGGPLLHASICHHGKPAQATAASLIPLWGAREDYDPLSWMQQLTAALLDVFPAACADGAELPAQPAFQNAFAGLVMLADWLGSDTRAFPYAKPGDPPRAQLARSAARRVLQEAWMDGTRSRACVTDSPPTFQQMFGFPEPRPAQAALRALPAARGGSVTILEAETGSGKTEASLARFIDLLREGAVDGLYFALPTRTAAVQIHARVTRVMQRTFSDAHPPVSLAVPGYLRVDDREGRHLAPFEVLWDDDPSQRYAFRSWAAEGPKRYLAGAVVVGTIDQLLLSALQVSHAHLRGFASLRHLLVIDEVHASDAYMTRILQEVLRRHLAAGGHALLLSATLGAEARAALLRPEAPGDAPQLNFEEAQETPYPLISQRSSALTSAVSVDEVVAQKLVEWRAWPTSREPAQVARRALEAARAGAKVLVIRNTVSDCVATQAALEALASPQDSELLFSCEGRRAPHHGRFAPEDRRLLDVALEAAFRDHAGLVVIATQTCEQSLDLDADLLLTDLCPMDVLLQRIGRLHRRIGALRPAGFERARCEVLVPPRRSLLDQAKPRGGGLALEGGLGTVYEDLRVLELTWRIVCAESSVQIPAQNRPLVEGALHSKRLLALEAEDTRWTTHRHHIEGKYAGGRTAAKLNLVDWRVAYDEQGFPGVEDQRKVSTRLGGEDRVLTLVPAQRSPFGATLRRVKVPEWMARDLDPEVSEASAKAEGEELLLEANGRLWRYSRWGLALES